MTRYVCAHPSHRRGSEPGSVDVTAQVRLERSLTPRTDAYLGITEDVIEIVKGLGEDGDRQRRIEQLLSGVTEPQDLPVILMSRRSIIRQPGRYQLDDLRTREPEVERVLAQVDPAFAPAARTGEDVVVIPDATTPTATGTATAQAPAAMLTRERQQPLVVIPEGVYPLHELAGNLAAAEREEDHLIEAILDTTPVHAHTAEVAAPWRVIVTCPRPEGSPAETHDVLFTGTGDPEPAVVAGTPVDAWDAELEAAALLDMAPGAETSRIERRTWMLLGVEVLIGALLLALAWASGGLALAARETTGWLALAFILGGAALAFAAAPFFAVRDRDGNMNDTYWVQYLYAARVDLFRLTAGISATLFAFALLVAVIPPMFADAKPLPAAAVTFDTTTSPITATVRVRATGFEAADTLTVTMREYGSGVDPSGVLLGHVTRHGSTAGKLSITETFAVDAGAGYISVLVSDGRTPDATCSPTAIGTPGCTVLAVPQFTPTASRLTIVAPTTITAVSPSPTISPSATGTPSTTTSP
ncbi:MAG TPA: hypothetical protein VFT27_04575 [Actinomycetota bacterium]|nr:hypothetical protein [Actinomycetota bacterium]